MIVIDVQPSAFYETPPAFMSAWRCRDCGERGHYRLGFDARALRRTVELALVHARKCAG